MNEIKFPKKTIKDISLDGKRILLRCDYNVPLKDGKITDDYRIIKSYETIDYLLAHGCKIVICSHLGRPNGEVNSEFSLKPVADYLNEKYKVKFVPASIGVEVEKATNEQNDEIILLENLRFDKREEANDFGFANALAQDSGADYFVQDGFGVVHRSNASTDAITKILPSVGGFLLEHEFIAIENAVNNPVMPLVTVMGGAKISDKIELVKKFIRISDYVVIGGALANNFLKAIGDNVGKSLIEPEMNNVAVGILMLAREKWGEKEFMNHILLPNVVAVKRNEKRVEIIHNLVQDDDVILDVGAPFSREIAEKIATAGTVIWNGPLGLTEDEKFAEGSEIIAEAIKNSPAKSIIGGGDTADFVRNWDKNSEKDFTHISTGGGASLELMTGDILPGIDCLEDK